MEISINEIAKILQDYDPEVGIADQEKALVSNVVLVDDGIKNLNPDLLYICDSRQFREIIKTVAVGNFLICRSQQDPLIGSDKEKLNRIFLKIPVACEVVYEKIRAAFLNKRILNRKKNELMAAHLSCRGLQHIIDVAYEVLGNPMFVSDLGYNILAFNKNANVGDPSWPTASREAELEAYERIKKLNDCGVFKRLYESLEPCIENFDYSPTRWMANKIVIKEKNIGHIAVVELHKPFVDMDLVLLQFLCEIVASELQKETISSGHFNNDFEHFLIDVLDQKITKPETVHKQGQKLKLNQQKYLLLATISFGKKAQNGMSLSYLKGIVKRLLRTEKIILYQNKITVFLASDKKAELSEIVKPRFRDFLETNEMNVGISQHFDDLTQLSKYYLQSVKAVELGTTLTPKENIFYYQNYAIYHLLETAGTLSNLKDFCDPVLMELLAYDKQYKTDYYHNLLIYLNNDGNVTKSAEYFQIHRNSMKYRIKKIEEILSISLSDMETKFSLVLSDKIVSFLAEQNVNAN